MTISEPAEVHDTARFLLWLMVFFIAVACVAIVGITTQSPDWYQDIARPSWTPADATFGKVWTVLYVLIAVAGCLVWTRRKSSVANMFWIAQLVANGAWSFLFFGLHRIDAALLNIVILLALIVGFILTARRVSWLAAGLFVPYLGWVCIATALNAHIWYLNGMPFGVFEALNTQ